MFNDDTSDWIRTLYQEAYPTAPQYQVGPRNRAARVMASPAQSQPHIQSQPQQMPWQMPQQSAPQPQVPNNWQTEVIPAQPGVTDVNKNVLPQPPINPILQNLQNIRHNTRPQPSVTRAPVRSVPVQSMPQQPQASNFNIDPNKMFPKPRNQFMGIPSNQAVNDFRSLSSRGISREDILRFLSSPDYANFRGGQHPSQ